MMKRKVAEILEKQLEKAEEMDTNIKGTPNLMQFWSSIIPSKWSYSQHRCNRLRIVTRSDQVDNRISK